MNIFMYLSIPTILTYYICLVAAAAAKAVVVLKQIFWKTKQKKII